MIILRVLLFVLGFGIVIATLASAIKTFVLPRSVRDKLTRRIFLFSRRIFNIIIRKRAKTYEDRDRIMALYAPVTLLFMPLVWLAQVLVGYSLMFFAVGAPTFYDAFMISGSSLLTLGFAPTSGMPGMLLEFSEAALGLILVALLIAYLPTMYSAFSQRESMVAMLEVRAGSPPSAVEMFKRFHRIGRMEELHQMWIDWERWFVFVEETHTSLAALLFFRSPQPDRSWLTAAGAVLDAAAMANATLDIPHDAQADLMIRAGYIMLRRIADFFGFEYNANPSPEEPISIMREEFEEAYDDLVAAGVPVKADREAAWRSFAGWRVNYDTVLLLLAETVMAPYAPWSSDRSLRRFRSQNYVKVGTPQVKANIPASAAAAKLEAPKTPTLQTLDK